MMKTVSWAAMATALMIAAPAAPIWAQQSAGAEQPVPGSADARLKALYDAEWDWRLKEEALLPNEDGRPIPRSEEHTSELQSLMRISYAVFCLKKKKKT